MPTFPAAEGDFARYQHAAEQLREAIYAGRIKPGDAIPEQDLAAEFGISRTPLREAIKVLHREGLVKIVPRQGAFVNQLSADELAELFPVMAMLEGRCAHAAALRLTSSELKDLAQRHESLEKAAKAADTLAYYDINFHFHLRVQELAGNRWLTQVTTDLSRILRLNRGRQLRLPGRLDQSLAEHRALMQAFERRDADAAERIMSDHLLSQARALKALDELIQQLQGH